MELIRRIQKGKEWDLLLAEQSREHNGLIYLFLLIGIIYYGLYGARSGSNQAERLIFKP